ncbi:ABC transporter substrate-binding protein [Tenggerimyces flavus]|uniref:ABC transporter substrate-binding protein n=1 Tax=Tenggerimyces flavus TaxID=1708749 RepID=A0ABV7YPD4_9ACTN|nr:extracellular solute-binding protein [Tenggerimyces flavus]MBM7784469.1 cellobiose transport system substrate-binding protein [Tenggerimyces flavus]
MALTRRQLLAGTASGLLGSALLGTAGCGRGAYLAPEDTISMWYWNRSISDTLLAKTPKDTGVKLAAQKIGGDFRAKLLTSLAGKAYVPDVTGLNEDIATYFPDEDQFFDLNELGAEEVKSQYLEWKWLRGQAPSGRFIGFPMDTGPTALYYREDLFEAAGLPTEPDEVAQRVATWDGFFELGTQLVEANPDVKLLPRGNDVFDRVVGQSGERYMDEQNRFIGDGEHLRRAWDLAIESNERKLTARIDANFSPEWNAAVSTGAVASLVGAVWVAQIMADGAKDTSGKWRLCRAPDGPGNWGGSFLGITKYCRDPEAAWEVVKYVQSPENQLVYGLNEYKLYPAAASALDDPRAQVEDPFFGGQVTNAVFAESAKEVKPVYLSPYDNVIGPCFTDQLTLTWSAGKDPDRAWQDALREVDRQLSHLGLI